MLATAVAAASSALVVAAVAAVLALDFDTPIS
jgi:hypothetical protein